MDPDVSIALVRNERWWGPKPGLESIVVRAIPEIRAQVQALESGEIGLIAPDADEDLIAQLRSGRNGHRPHRARMGPHWDLYTFNTLTRALADLGSARRSPWPSIATPASTGW